MEYLTSAKTSAKLNMQNRETLCTGKSEGWGVNSLVGLGWAGLGSAHWRREICKWWRRHRTQTSVYTSTMCVCLHTHSGGSRETFIYFLKKGFVEAADWTNSGSPVTGVWNTTVLQQIRVRVKVILQCHVHLLRICQLETGSYSWMISL